MRIILKDNGEIWQTMLPVTFTRPVSELMCGMLTLRQWWQLLLPGEYGYEVCSPCLEEAYPKADENVQKNIYVPSEIVPSEKYAAFLLSSIENPDAQGQFEGEPERIGSLFDLFENCGKWIERQFPLVAKGEKQGVPAGTTLIGPEDRLFIHPTAKVWGATINTLEGPVYIGEDALVGEGACLRGPVAVMERSHVNMGAKIYGPTAIGHDCRVGGELNNVVMHPYSNKAHDGFLGNAVIGSWCNLGAGCTASNLKNDYADVRLWNYATHRFERTGKLFCGLIMGDHSKAGINTMFNTASSVGVGVNVHGSGFPRTYLANFHEGSASAGFTKVSFGRFIESARKVMRRRDVELTAAQERMLRAIYDGSE